MSEIWTWVVLATAVIAMLGFDLAFFGRRSQQITFSVRARVERGLGGDRGRLRRRRLVAAG